MPRRIQNFDALATNALRLDALSIAEAGYAAVNTGAAVERALRIAEHTLSVGGKEYPLAGRNLFFVGVGKCAFAAARAVEKVFGDSLTGGIALDVSPVEGGPLRKIEAYVGTHPLPSDVNEDATKHIVEFLSGRSKDDLVIILVSGGGSTLLCSHEAPMTCADESILWNELTLRGATIQDINTVRKHTSRARGGGLAAAAYPAEVIALVISDVPGNDVGFVASGPTVLDASTVADAREILARYEIASPANIALIETPKDPKYFEHATTVLFLTNDDALEAMKKEASARGYSAQIENDRLTGEAREVGRAIAEQLHRAGPKTALLYAGETTVTLGEHHGAGGRNQEIALAALADIRDGELILPFSSDGRDNTDVAGAISDAPARAYARAQNLSMEEHLENHRAYDFFTTTEDALLTGYTGANVSDLVVALKS